MFLIVAHLLSGALHELFHMDVTAPQGQIVVSMSSIHTDTPSCDSLPSGSLMAGSFLARVVISYPSSSPGYR